MRRNVDSSFHLTIDWRNKCTIVLNLDLSLLGGCVDGVSAALGSLLSISGAGDGEPGHIGRHVHSRWLPCFTLEDHAYGSQAAARGS